ncbi:MAG: DUF2232 domain-containing protein [Clostridia bacterium]|nr:DUF2232 domain-containing protein [Clostridia bacterium]
MKNHSKFLFYPILLFCGFLLFVEKTVPAILLLNISTAFFTAKFSFKHTLFGILCILAFSAYCFGMEPSLFTGLFILPAFILGLNLNLRTSFSALLITSTIAEVSALTLYTRHISSVLNMKPVDLLFGSTLDMVGQSFSTEGMLPPELGSDVTFFVRQISNILQTMLPAFYILFSIFCVYLLFSLVRFLLEKTGHTLDLPRFHELSFPRSISTIFILIYLISMFANSPILSNVASVMFALHVVCGLSLVDFFFVEKKIPKAARRIILAIIIIISSFLGGLTTTLLCCFGMNNSIRSFRK